MLNLRPSKKSISVELTRHEIDISIGAGEVSAIKLIFPPLSELRDIEENYRPRISISEAIKQDPFNYQEMFSDEFGRLKLKLQKFKDSSTFFNHLANYCSLMGNPAEARGYLKQAVEIGDKEFFSSRIASTFVQEGNINEAFASLSGSPIESSARVNIQFALLSLLNDDPESGARYAEQALILDAANGEANIIRAGIHLMFGELESAVRHFRVAVQETNASSTTYVNLAFAYYMLRQPEKALKELKKAVAINPINANAVVFLADLLNGFGRANEAIPRLNTFLRFEQKEGVIWNRLARSYFLDSDYVQALEALKHEANLKSTPSILNNIAVVHSRLGNSGLAERFYRHALRQAHKFKAPIGLISANIAGFYLAENLPKEALAISTAALIYEDSLQEEKLENVFPRYVAAVASVEGSEAGIVVAESRLEGKIKSNSIRLELLRQLIGFLANVEPVRERIEPYIEQALECLEADPGFNQSRSRGILNNVMFAYLQIGNLDSAISIGKKISNLVHEDPFITATFGLYHIKRGQIDRGQGLYQEAIGISHDQELKCKIRQRMNLELGSYLLTTGDTAKSNYFLQKARNEKFGSDFIKARAKTMLQLIKGPDA